MKSISLRFKTVQRLESFIKQNLHDNIIAHITLPENKQDTLDVIVKTLKENINNIKIIGNSANTSLLNTTISDDIVINFFLIDDAKVSYHKNIYECRFEPDSLYIIFGSQVDKKSFFKNYDKDINIVASLHNKYIIYDENIFYEGLVSIEINSITKSNLDIKIVDAIEPVGRELSITKAEKSTIYEVEHLSPKELHTHYLSKNISQNLIQASYTFPLLKKEGELFNSSLIFLNDHAIKVDYEVSKDDKVQIGFSNSSRFYEIYENSIKELNKNQSDILFILFSDARSDFLKTNGFEFDCAIGCSSKSEVVVQNGICKSLSHSIVMINIKKDGNNTLKSKRFTSIKNKIHNINQLDALSNIAKVSSKELQDLNTILEKKVQKEVEKNLRKDSILIHRSRLAQMGEMLSLIAHQWKQPLSAISATSSGLHIKIELDMYDKDFFLKSLTKIEDFVKHLSNTIDDFSNFFKPSKVKKEFYIYEAINKSLSIASYSLTKNSISVDLDIDESIKITSFENELIQVLLNLIKNAENVLVKREINEPKITIKAYKKDNKIIIDVIDNAGGIDRSIMNKIFEPYFSTKATKDSTGLGLYMSKYIITESLGGKLLVKNEKKGAAFSIILV